MSEWAIQMGTFTLQIIIVLVVIGVGIALVAKMRQDSDEQLNLHIEVLNDQRRYRRRRLAMATAAPNSRKKLLKKFRRDDKARLKGKEGGSKNLPEVRPEHVWVLDYHGDIKASGTDHLAQEISALLEVAEHDDEVVVRLESGGGLVHAYGLASAELDRLRNAGLKTVVCVDKVAASGGYMMACTASQVRAAPFAVIGSIGVVAQVPNVHRLLKRHDVDVELLTAGKYKRTLTMLGENTDEGREKFVEDLENTHRLFKDYVAQRRPSMDIDALATGEIWYGSEALQNGLVDAVDTSEAYLVERMKEAQVLLVRLDGPKPLSKKLGLAISGGVESAIVKLVGALDAARWQKH
ncbi:protease SohB [Halomonas sp. Bachu 37]|uniref:protease SohB n=1 Tax=Halomonas kashgarensis TaxID=3084920 RepID=UPI003217D950